MTNEISQLERQDNRVAGPAVDPSQTDVFAGGAPGTDTSLHQIVIIGGGAAGLELVTRLGDTLGRKGKAAITLIDGNRGHLWKPLLYEVAAGSLDVHEHELDYLAHAHWHHYRY